MIETMEDQDAEQVKKWFSDLYAKIEKRVVKEGFTPENVDQWISRWFGWPNGSKYRVMCVNAARSIYRKHQAAQLEAAQEALKKAGSG